MHELSVCHSILNQVNNIANRHQATFVETIYLQIGPLSGVEPELLRSAFPIAGANTIASEANLVIHSIPIRVYCKSCEQESEADINNLICGHCGDWRTVLVSGDELLLERIELQKVH